MKAFTALLFLFSSFTVMGQDLMDLLGDDNGKPNFTTATFKTTRIVNGQAITAPSKGELIFIISHNFGKVNSGAYNFFGLDQSTIRIGLEYSPLERLCIGVGRSSMQKNFDGFLKYKILRQSTGSRNMPISMSYFSSISLNSLHWQYPDRTNYFTSRLGYVHQLLIARKFSPSVSIQLSPTLVHRNIVALATEKNDIYAFDAGGRVKLTKRMSLNAEYQYVLPNQLPSANTNCLSLGVDIETGGHVFQFHVTNGQGLFERNFITETTGDWTKGDIFFGFNITRAFTLYE